MKWSWYSDHADDLWSLSLQHMQMTLLAVLGGVLIAAPLGVLAHLVPAVRGAVLALSGVLFTIPSLALFILLLPLTGLTQTTAVIGLTVYTLVVLVRNMIEGLAGVPPQVRQAARAIGYGRFRTLATVELPLALPVIMAGVRIATVMTISLVSVAGLIGQGALGQLFTDGLQRDFSEPIVAGIVLTLVLAMVADVALIGLQRALTPWTRR
jgi:osmoprotectant transport system permease protein